MLGQGQRVKHAALAGPQQACCLLPARRIPPHMKPMKLKQLLSQHGETLRVYCTPEDPRARKMRKSKGGNTGAQATQA